MRLMPRRATTTRAIARHTTTRAFARHTTARPVGRLLAGVALAAALGLIGTSCGDDGVDDGAADQSSPDTSVTSGGATDAGGTSDSSDELSIPAVDLVDLDLSLQEPIALVAAPSGGSLLIAERSGRVVEAVQDGDGFSVVDDPVIDLRDRVGSTDAEKGLLGIAIDPSGEHLYASYTRAADGSSQLDEFELSGPDGSLEAEPDSRRELLNVDQPFPNHNGGHVAFGPDGMLYLGLGDGGSSGDPGGRAQDPGTLLGKILRLDPTSPTGIPEDNPFIGDDPLDARDEIWATGVRNPWRFSFDPKTGDLWIGDVGQGEVEEIDRLTASDGGGRGTNLGWDLFEGDREFDDADPASAGASDGPFVEPVFTYEHDEGCSVTGGVVVRGESWAGLDGSYLFGDFCTPGIRAVVPAADGTVGGVALTDDPAGVVGFAQGATGRVFVISLDEGISELVAT